MLAQIIFEEEGKSGQNLLPIKFLRQLIRFYGDSLQGLLPSYLELSMDSFSREQEKMRGKIAGVFGGTARLGQFEEQIRQNFAVFDGAMRMFSPFATRPRGDKSEPRDADNDKTAAPEAEAPSSELDELKRQLAAMQAHLENLAKK